MANTSESASPLSLLFYLLQRLFEILTAMAQMQEATFFHIMKSMSLQIFQWWFFHIRERGGCVCMVLYSVVRVFASGVSKQKADAVSDGAPAVAEVAVLWFRPGWSQPRVQTLTACGKSHLTGD